MRAVARYEPHGDPPQAFWTTGEMKYRLRR